MFYPIFRVSLIIRILFVNNLVSRVGPIIVVMFRKLTIPIGFVFKLP